VRNNLARQLARPNGRYVRFAACGCWWEVRGATSRQPRSPERAIARRGEFGADLVSLGRADVGEDRERFLPVPASQPYVARCGKAAGEAVVGVGLLVSHAGLGG